MDRVSPRVRSQVMSSVRSTGTRLERGLAEALRKAKLRTFQTNPKDIEGRPDFVFRKSCVAVFVDSCFWHGCRWHCRMPAANADYWRAKIARNRQRDKRVTRLLRRRNWRVVRVWEHTIKDEAGLAWAVERIRGAIKDQ